MENTYEVLGPDGSIVIKLSEVINRWERDFKGLFSSEILYFDDDYYKDICLRKNVLESQILKEEYCVNEDLNKDFTDNEVRTAISKAKLGKATGVENVSIEILQSPKLFDILCKLFRICFEFDKIPSMWLKSIINPIPKSQREDPRVH